MRYALCEEAESFLCDRSGQFDGFLGGRLGVFWWQEMRFVIFYPIYNVFSEFFYKTYKFIRVSLCSSTDIFIFNDVSLLAAGL